MKVMQFMIDVRGVDFVNYLREQKDQHGSSLFVKLLDFLQEEPDNVQGKNVPLPWLFARLARLQSAASQSFAAVMRVAD